MASTVAATHSEKTKSTSLQLIGDLRSNLELLGPLIGEIENYNRDLNREDMDIPREAKQQLEEGILLVQKVVKVKSFDYDSKKYTKKLVILNKSITTWLERLRVQARDLRMELLMRQQIDEQRRANERYESNLINTADPVVEPHEPDNQIQLADQVYFLRRTIQNWVVNRSSYGLWAILVLLFSVIMVVMTAGGSAGTKWVVLNVGINHLGINNY